MGLVVYNVAYLRTKWHLDLSSPLATTDMGLKLVGRAIPFGGAGSVSNAMWPGVKAYLHTKWHLDPSRYLATTDMGLKFGGCAPFGAAGSPSNTMWPGPRPTSMPSFILMQPTVWPQYTNVTDRQVGQTDSTGQTMVR